ncbi:questin oxidase family protein [Streptomyces lichenis]|uniref:Questin oxidase family protein n=1 Tax=Streptomyces lichenis TaxID=2306967 RepID=A0ABT0I7Z1_9ACTN|nr:questin oxidase family protein [Streptomyces lichenis]MCK8677424.1 questin oxidase family protein [Streptomyces lichenis]
MTTTEDTSGTLDEALERLHRTGPEFQGWLSNHGPMVVEALVRGGQSRRVHRWLDHYQRRLHEMPARTEEVTPENWREALGDPARITDWTDHFRRETAERPWREVLTEWWPRLLPGIAAGATHPVIRTGHAVHALLGGEETEPRTGELAHALGYWAARHQPLPPLTEWPAPAGITAALDAVPPVPHQEGGILGRLDQLTGLPQAPAADGPEQARARLTELVAAATHRYGTHGHGDPVMLVHAATAPNAVLRTLPALPRELWPASLAAAWSASAAVTAAYTPAVPRALAASRTPADAGELLARAAAHGDDHAIKFADTALAVGDPAAIGAALHALELIPPADD